MRPSPSSQGMFWKFMPMLASHSGLHCSGILAERKTFFGVSHLFPLTYSL